MALANISVFCIDVGSVQFGWRQRRGCPRVWSNGFGWVRATHSDVIGNNCMDDCVAHLASDVADGRPIALGLESPLFLPVPRTADALSRGREGERDRSCFAPAGGYVATLGLHELAYVISAVPGIAATLDWTGWQNEPKDEMLIWEAFVSGTAHTESDDHVADAATAAVEFLARLRGSGLCSDVTVAEGHEALSLAGAALLWAGAADDVAILHAPTLVVKPTDAHRVVVSAPASLAPPPTISQ